MVIAAKNISSLPATEEQFSETFTELKSRFDAMEPELALTLTDPDMDVEGYIVVWNTNISKGGPLDNTGKGCGKGGTRITPDVTLDDIKMLARSAALKNAAAGLPMGGAKTGLKANPKAPDFEQKYRRFVQLCAPYLRENGGIWGGFGFDIGAAPIHALWACDELNSTTCFTGKPVEMGGTDYDHEGIAGLGVAVAARTLLEYNKKPVENARFAVQGLGAMGAAVLRYFSEYGGQLAALADPKYGGTWIFDNETSGNLQEALTTQDVETAIALISKEGRKISDDPQDVLYQEVDVLFPCAIQYVITKDNADRVNAGFISEGANNPISTDVYEDLIARGIHFVPDFIANPGGVIAAFVELTSDITPEENAKTRAKVKEAKDMTISKISDNVREMLEMVEALNADPSHVGQYMAYRNILGAE